MAQEQAREAGLPTASRGPARYLVLILLIMVLEAACAYVLLDWAIPAPEQVAQTPEEAEVKEKESPPPIFFTALQEVVFSPLDSRGGILVQATLALEVDREAVLAEMDLKREEMWDLVLRAMENASTEDLRDPAKERVKAMVMEVINKNLRNGEVTGVYFVDYIMQ